MACFKVYHLYKLDSNKRKKVLCKWCARSTNKKLYIYHIHKQQYRKKCFRCTTKITNKGHHLCVRNRINGNPIAHCRYFSFSRLVECSESDNSSGASSDSGLDSDSTENSDTETTDIETSETEFDSTDMDEE